MTFANRLFEALLANADRPALSSDRESLTHGEVREQVLNLSANLAAVGVGPGDRVGIAIQDSIGSLMCAMACWRLAATPAMIDFRAPRAHRARLLRDFELVTVIESRTPPGTETYPSTTYDPDWRYGAALAAQDGALDCSNPAFLLFSSGTTGDPKAYIQTHDALLERTGHRLAAPPDGRQPRYLTGMTLTYSATRHYVLAHLLGGASVRLIPPLFTESQMIEALLSFEATGTSQPPPVIARMLQDAGERADVLFPLLQRLDSVGGPARPDDKVAAWRNLSHGYRITYASSLTGMIAILAGEHVVARPESAGRIATGVRVDILDAEGQPLPLGEAGRIRAHTRTMASAVLMPGGRQFVDPAVMGPGWGIPGDIGRLDADGFLTIVDRSEDMIVRGGVNIAPQELEKLIRTHAKVKDVAIAGFEDAVMGQEIAAFVVGTPDLTVGDLRAFLAANVPPERRPRELRLVAALPYSDHGKLLRRVLVDSLTREAGDKS